MKTELTADLTFSEEEQSLLTMHSVLNVLNTVMLEVRRLRDVIGNHPSLEEAEDVIIEIADDLRNAELATDHLAAAESFAAKLTALLDEAIGSRPELAESRDVEESRENIRNIFAILKVRAQELVARAENPDAWVEHDIPGLTKNFLEVFSAIEQNSHGGYRIVYNLASHEEGDYFVDFGIASFRGDTIQMPAVLQDVMRDLIANARKYTAPGGRIIAGLDESPARLRFVVEDSGRGIPADDLPHVIGFGYRGRNVQDRQTRGGGFGLTKAFYFTRRHGGRMWIESEEGSGTRIEIEIPSAQSA